MKKLSYRRVIIFLLIVSIIISHRSVGKGIEVYASQTGIVTANSLNVRSKPSTTASKVNLNGSDVFLTKDEIVTILEKDGDWYYVLLKFNGKTVKGYVLSDYIKADKKNTAGPTTTPKPTAKPTATPKPTAKPTATPKPTAKPTATPQPTKAADSTAKDAVTVVKEVSIKATVSANTLNVRSGPGTKYSKVASLAKGNSVTVIQELMEGDSEWYGISFKSGKKTITGYVASDFIKLSYDSKITGEASQKIKIRSTASSKAAYVKNKKGNVISLSKGKDVNLLDETVVSGKKWFKISFTVDKVKYTGYVQSDQIHFKVTVVKPTPTPKPTATPTPAPSPTPTETPEVTVTVTPTPTVSPTPTSTPTPTQAPTATPSPGGLIEIPNIEVRTDIYSATTGIVCNTVYLNVYENVLASMALLQINNKEVILNNGEKITVTGYVTLDGNVWYEILTSSGRNGHVQAEYVYIGDRLPDNAQNTLLTPTPTPVIGYTNDVDFETKLALENFPESYKEPLRQLHMLYPEWEFKAYHTGLDWNTVISAESIPGKNLLPNSKSIEWKSLEDGAYKWEKDQFTVYDGSTWVTASKAAIEYYMDPRNFLTDSGIFQFEVLKYRQNYQNPSGVENILRGTALYNKYYSFTDDNGVNQTYSYGETFIKAAEYSGVSPYHLASRVKQEVVTGPNSLSNSVSGTYQGYEGYYNFYNIGANDSAGGGAIANGLKYAKNGSTSVTNNQLYMIPWTNPFRSIVGGSYFLGGTYINRGQDTIYLQKFNVTPTSTFYHQYMSNVEAPYAEAKKIKTAYDGMIDSPIEFSIPVYANMPASAVSAPTTMFNPNNRMKSLKILDMSGNELVFSPSFSQTELNYSLFVNNNVDAVEIQASAVSKLAMVQGTGVIPLQVGNNEIIIPVIAQNGDVANYTINIVRE